MKHIVSFSGGKDSTAMLLRMLEEGWPVDEIVFMDTGKEFPAMYKHIEQVQAYIGRKITVLKDKHGFDYWMFEHVKTKGPRQGQKGYGWPDHINRWCTGTLKRDQYSRYIKKYKRTVAYQGIALDEKERAEKNAGHNIRYPLIEWGMKESDALGLCYSRGFDWGGLYEHFSRVSCWCCPLKSLPEWRNLYKYYPELWAQLKDMDSRAGNKFKDRWTVAELEARFAEEAQQMNFTEVTPM